MVDMRTREGRALREQESRENDVRAPAWQPGGLLPTPYPKEGVTFRWIRTTSREHQDVMNVSMRLREGWVPVKRVDVPELGLMVQDHNSKWPDNVEIGGLLLCMIDNDRAAAARKYEDNRARSQMTAVDHNFMREQDPRMPLLKPERSSRVTFGGGAPPR